MCFIFVFVLCLLISWETYLSFKMKKEGLSYKFNNKRVIGLKELNPGTVRLENMVADPFDNKTMFPVAADKDGFLLPSPFCKKPDITLAFMGDSITYGAYASMPMPGTRTSVKSRKLVYVIMRQQGSICITYLPHRFTSSIYPVPVKFSG